MAPGAYGGRVEGPGRGPRTSQVGARAGEDKQLDLELRALVSDPGVSLAAGKVQVNKPIRFAGATAQLTAPAQHLLDAVADLLQFHGEIKRVHISAHWDNSLPRPRAPDRTGPHGAPLPAPPVARGPRALCAAGPLAVPGSCQPWVRVPALWTLDCASA